MNDSAALEWAGVQDETYMYTMGARRGGGTCPSLEFEKITSYAAVLQNTKKLSLAPSALAIDNLRRAFKKSVAFTIK